MLASKPVTLTPHPSPDAAPRSSSEPSRPRTGFVSGLELAVLALAVVITFGQEACTGPQDSPLGPAHLHETTSDDIDSTDIDENDVGVHSTIAAPVTVVAAAQRVHEAKALLDASLSYDSDNDPFVVTWTQIEGPETVDFPEGDAGLVVPVLLPQAGVYRFRAKAWDSDGSTAQDYVVVRENHSIPQRRFVVQISVDGLHPQALVAAARHSDRGFARFLREGATTLNARTDPAFTVTLPNHTSQLTSRFVNAPGGHMWQRNAASTEDSLHVNAGAYVTSIFDVLHAQGIGGALYSGKSKFILYDNSYGRLWDTNGQVVPTKRPLANTVIQPKLDRLLAHVLTDLEHAPRPHTFVHFAEPDNMGHSFSWDLADESRYRAGVQAVDGALAAILATIERSAVLRDATAVIVTADHGGVGFAHDAIANPNNYTIPFLVWGAGIAAGADLYAMNPGRRADPATLQVAFDAPQQPIRNGDAANLAAALLGWPAVPQSQINALQDLQVEANR